MNYTQSTSTVELEVAAEAYWCPNPFPQPEGFSRGFIRAFKQHCGQKYGGYPSEAVSVALISCVEDLYDQEGFHQVAFKRQGFDNPIDRGRYRDFLFGLVRFAEHSPEAVVADFVTRALTFLDHFLGALPPEAFFPTIAATPEPDTPTTPFLDIIDNQTHLLVSDMVQSLRPLAPFGFFGGVRGRLEDNSRHVFKGAVIEPADWRGDPRKAPKAFLDGTPLYDLFQLDIPIRQPPKLPEPAPSAPDIAEHQWYRHALLVAAPGQGKTNAIRWRIAQLLPQIARGEASLILLEPKGVLTREILECEIAWELRERLVIIDPADPVAINLFDRGDNSPLAINETIARISRVFETITAGLTAMQRSMFTFALRALFALPTPPSIRMFRRILREGIAGLPVQNLSSGVQDFFEYDFPQNRSRAREILDRLNNLLADPVFEALFDSEHSTFDMFDAMQGGKLIIINAASVDALYGRFWIEEVARCIKPRFEIKSPNDRVPTTFVIDEAQNYVAQDLHFAKILDEAREARIGIFMACQHMGQIKDDHVRHSIYNSNLKFIANTNGDIHNLCRSMGQTEPAFIQTMAEYHFGFYGPNMSQASTVYLPLVEFDRLNKISDEQSKELRRINRSRYADQDVARAERERLHALGAVRAQPVRNMEKEQVPSTPRRPEHISPTERPIPNDGADGESAPRWDGPI